MMKRIVFLLVFIAVFGQYIQAGDEHTAVYDKVEDVVGVDKDYILYRFGEAKEYSIIIVERATENDVFVCDETNDILYSTTCETTPLLRWVFNDLSKDLSAVSFSNRNDYSPIYYDLTLHEDSKNILIDSSSNYVTGGDKISRRIGELKEFMIRFWVTYVQTQKIFSS